MAADSPPPPPPAPAAIAALSDDILREIFLRLPDVTTLARAAFTCRAFLHAVRSSPAFRRRFRELHAPPLLVLFLMPKTGAIVLAEAGKSSDIDASFQNYDASKSECRSPPYYLGWSDIFVSRATGQRARYNPYLRALNIYPRPRDGSSNAILEFHTLFPDGEEQWPSRVVCVHRERAWAWARVAVFSSQTMEWQVVLPEVDNYWGLLDGHERAISGRVVNGFICWVHKVEGCILALNTATFQFSQMDLPSLWEMPYSMFQLGHTRDGKFCVVNVLQCMLSVWLWAADDDGVERFMLHKSFSLRTNANEITKCSEETDVTMWPRAVINGFMYLSLMIDKNGRSHSPEWLVSCCLETETAEVNLLHKERHRSFCSVYPYILVSWPSSLIHGKEDSESIVTGNISEDDGPMGTDEASPVLFTALQSFKEKLIDDGNSNFAEVDDFLLDDKMNSLLNRICTLESGLAAARDRVLRIRTEPNSMNVMEIVTSESESAARNPVLRIGTESDNMEGMDRVSCWQMCKVTVGRAYTQFFSR